MIPVNTRAYRAMQKKIMDIYVTLWQNVKKYPVAVNLFESTFRKALYSSALKMENSSAIKNVCISGPQRLKSRFFLHTASHCEVEL